MTVFLSDEQLVERIRKSQRYRRPMGSIFACLGIAWMLFAAFAVHKFHVESDAILQCLAHAPDPTQQQSLRFAGYMGVWLGFGLGFAFAFGLSIGLFLTVIGCECLLGTDRRNALLLKCWDRTPAASK